MINGSTTTVCSSARSKREALRDLSTGRSLLRRLTTLNRSGASRSAAATEVSILHRTRVRFQAGLLALIFSSATMLSVALPAHADETDKDSDQCSAAAESADYFSEELYCTSAAEGWSVRASGAPSAKMRYLAKFIESTFLLKAAEGSMHNRNTAKAHTQVITASQIFSDCIKNDPVPTDRASCKKSYPQALIELKLIEASPQQ